MQKSPNDLISMRSGIEYRFREHLRISSLKLTDYIKKEVPDRSNIFCKTTVIGYFSFGDR